MSASDDGGPAFPRSPHTGDPTDDGMSLRDWFAGQALATWRQDMDPEWNENDVAKFAYAIANAMLRARAEVKP